MWVYLAGLLLIALVSWIAARPFLRGAGAPSEAPEPERDRWGKQRDEALAAIKEAEFDFHLGKLSETDYRDLRRRLEARAVEAIRAREGGRHGDA